MVSSGSCFAFPDCFNSAQYLFLTAFSFRPGIALEITLHFRPICLCRVRSSASSEDDHADFLRLGSRWFIQRPRHYLEDFVFAPPWKLSFIMRAKVTQFRAPYFVINSISSLSSEGSHSLDRYSDQLIYNPLIVGINQFVSASRTHGTIHRLR